MSSQTTTTALTTEQTALVEARDAKVVEYDATRTRLQEALTAKGAASPKSDAHKKAQAVAWSEGGKLANRKHEIRQIELDLRLEGVEFEPWTEPAKAASGTRLTPMSQDEVEAKLAKLRELAKTGVPESVQHDIDVRIRSLLKAAEVRGYQVS